jgi:hypothetical protein
MIFRIGKSNYLFEKRGPLSIKPKKAIKTRVLMAFFGFYTEGSLFSMSMMFR